MAALSLCLCLGLPVQARAQAATAPLPAASPQAVPAVKPVLPADLPLRRDAQPGLGSGAGYAVWLVLLAGAGAWAWIWSVRRRGAAPEWLGRWVPAGSPGVLQLLASKPLAPHCSLHVVRWGGRELLVGCTPQAVTLLETREAAAPEQTP
jgi:hypothetical protein